MMDGEGLAVGYLDSFNPNSMSERTKRASMYSSKCAKRRSNSEAKITEFIVNVSLVFIAISVLSFVGAAIYLWVVL